jgi:hypothetical protein
MSEVADLWCLCPLVVTLFIYCSFILNRWLPASGDVRQDPSLSGGQQGCEE